ncbi:MAG: TrkA family potassium uptake protein [Candidatus Aminicenantes bacterium]|nr:TrkA family potassium uptake protein [Candidatus Aminicenantes bacterium]
MKFGVIGLGSFGFHVARTLFEMNEEVLAIDHDKERADLIKNYASHVVHMEAADKENLKAVGIQEMDVVIISLGPNMEGSILTVHYLSEMHIKRIIAKALSEDHAKILEAVGASEVIYPERDMAVKTAMKLSNPNVLDFLPLSSGIEIREIAPPEEFIGKSLMELDLINRYEIQVIAVKGLVPEKTTLIPKADFVIKDSDVLMVIGPKKQLKKICSK